MSEPTPILLLKDRSLNQSPDPYESLFTPPQYISHTIPVLHYEYPNSQGIETILSTALSPYGGIIFTSPRAVHAFNISLKKLENGERTEELDRLKDIKLPFYVVGPATAELVKQVQKKYFPNCIVQGEEAGNGEKLAKFILESYQLEKKHGGNRDSLLFLCGEKRRDVIPKMLMDEELGAKKIFVEEMVVYVSYEVSGLAEKVRAVWEGVDKTKRFWVLMCSPNGSEIVLRTLGLIDERTLAAVTPIDTRVRVVSIGPTTRDYLRKTFGFEVDVSAEIPSPEGVMRAIEAYEESNS